MMDDPDPILNNMDSLATYLEGQSFTMLEVDIFIHAVYLVIDKIGQPSFECMTGINKDRLVHLTDNSFSDASMSELDALEHVVKDTLSNSFISIVESQIMNRIKLVCDRYVQGHYGIDKAREELKYILRLMAKDRITGLVGNVLNFKNFITNYNANKND